MSEYCVFATCRPTPTVRLVDDIFPRGVRGNGENIVINGTKIDRLTAYAVSYPKNLPDICGLLENRLRKYYVSNKVGLVEICIAAFRDLLVKCIDADLVYLVQPFFINASFLLLRSPNILFVTRGANLFLEYTQVSERSDFSVFTNPILELCNGNKSIESEVDLYPAAVIGFKLLLRLIDVMLSRTAQLEVHTKAILRTIYRVIKENRVSSSSPDFAGAAPSSGNLVKYAWQCLTLLSSVSSPATLSQLVVHIIELFEEEHWEPSGLVVEIFVAIATASTNSNSYNAPIIRTLFEHTQRLVAKDIEIPNAGGDGGKGFGLFPWFQGPRKSQGSGEQVVGYNYSLPELGASLDAILDIVVTILESAKKHEEAVATVTAGIIMSPGAATPVRKKTGISAVCSPSQFKTSFDEDMTHLLSVLLFVVLFANPESRLPDGELTVLGGRLDKLASLTSGKGLHAVVHDVDVASMSLDAEEQNEALDSVLRRLWKCMSLIAQEQMPLGHSRAAVLPNILRFIDAAEGRIYAIRGVTPQPSGAPQSTSGQEIAIIDSELLGADEHEDEAFNGADNDAVVASIGVRGGGGGGGPADKYAISGGEEEAVLGLDDDDATTTATAAAGNEEENVPRGGEGMFSRMVSSLSPKSSRKKLLTSSSSSQGGGEQKFDDIGGDKEGALVAEGGGGGGAVGEQHQGGGGDSGGNLGADEDYEYNGAVAGAGVVADEETSPSENTPKKIKSMLRKLGKMLSLSSKKKQPHVDEEEVPAAPSDALAIEDGRAGGGDHHDVTDGEMVSIDLTDIKAKEANGNLGADDEEDNDGTGAVAAPTTVGSETPQTEKKKKSVLKSLGKLLTFSKSPKRKADPAAAELPLGAEEDAVNPDEQAAGGGGALIVKGGEDGGENVGAADEGDNLINDHDNGGSAAVDTNAVEEKKENKSVFGKLGRMLSLSGTKKQPQPQADEEVPAAEGDDELEEGQEELKDGGGRGRGLTSALSAPAPALMVGVDGDPEEEEGVAKKLSFEDTEVQNPQPLKRGAGSSNKKGSSLMAKMFSFGKSPKPVTTAPPAPAADTVGLPDAVVDDVERIVSAGNPAVTPAAKSLLLGDADEKQGAAVPHPSVVRKNDINLQVEIPGNEKPNPIFTLYPSFRPNPFPAVPVDKTTEKIVNAFRVYALYVMNILVSNSDSLSGAGLMLDALLPLNPEAVCHLCLLLHTRDASIVRQVTGLLLNLLSSRKSYAPGDGRAVLLDTSLVAINKWAPFTAIQVSVVRDAIFNILCASNSPVSSTLAVWGIQASLLSSFGVSEFVHGLPMILAVEQFWRVFPLDSLTEEELHTSNEMLGRQRVFFLAYLLLVAKLFDCAPLKKIADAAYVSWGKHNVLSRSLSIGSNGIEEAGIGLAPTGLNPFEFSELSPLHKDGSASDIHHGLAPAPVAADGEVLPEISRQELLAAFFVGGGLRSDTMRIRQAFEVEYVPQEDPFVRVEELCSVPNINTNSAATFRDDSWDEGKVRSRSHSKSSNYGGSPMRSLPPLSPLTPFTGKSKRRAGSSRIGAVTPGSRSVTPRGSRISTASVVSRSSATRTSSRMGGTVATMGGGTEDANISLRTAGWTTKYNAARTKFDEISAPNSPIREATPKKPALGGVASLLSTLDELNIAEISRH